MVTEEVGALIICTPHFVWLPANEYLLSDRLLFLLFFLSGIPIMHMATLAVAALESVDILFRFFSIFVLFAFSCLGILLIYPELRDYFLSCVWSKINQSKAFFISVSMFFICSISFLFFLKISGYLLTLLL